MVQQLFGIKCAFKFQHYYEHPQARNNLKKKKKKFTITYSLTPPSSYHSQDQIETSHQVLPSIKNRTFIQLSPSQLGKPRVNSSQLDLRRLPFAALSALAPAVQVHDSFERLVGFFPLFLVNSHYSGSGEIRTHCAG